MPSSRVRQHIASTHTSLNPALVGQALDTNQQARNKKYAEIVQRKRNLIQKPNDPNDTNGTEEEVSVAAATEDAEGDAEVERESTLASEVSLYGTWINDVVKLELKHLIVFNNDNTGALKSQGNVDGLGAKRINFNYRLSEDLKSIDMTYLLISPLEENPFEIAKYVTMSPETIKETVTLKIRVFEAVPDESDVGYLFVAPSGKQFEPFLALEFDKSPWPEGLFPDRKRYYGVLKRIPLAKKVRPVLKK